MPHSAKYLLGDSRREAVRLRAQERLWDPVSHSLFDRIGVAPGWSVLEIGPGQGSIHAELRRRVGAPIDAVEPSSAFAKRQATICARDGFGRGRVWRSRLLSVDLPRDTYDLIFARWVFLFLPDPGAHLRHLVRALKPGGFLALQEYHRETFTLVPTPDAWATFLAAERQVYAAGGGDVSIGGRLPQLFRGAGLRLVDIVPTVMTGHPGSDVWNWLSDYYLPILPRYAGRAKFDRAAAAALRRHWRSAARDPRSVMIAPAVLDVVGRRP